MEILKPFGGYGAENYRQAFDVNGENFMINGEAERTMEKVFAPREISDSTLKFKIGGALVVGIIIYFLLRKKD